MVIGKSIQSNVYSMKQKYIKTQQVLLSIPPNFFYIEAHSTKSYWNEKKVKLNASTMIY